MYYLCEHRRIEQLAARRAHNPEVVGSSPTPAIKRSGLLMQTAFFMFFSVLVGNWSISDLNRPPIDCEPIALPDELMPQMKLILA